MLYIFVCIDIYAETEAIKVHLEQLKREETALAEERKLLESEKAAHQKELKRCYSEDQSRFQKELPLLHHRYLLQSLLGKGGFSEVWKALDIIELKEVAVKVLLGFIIIVVVVILIFSYYYCYYFICCCYY